MTQNNHKVLKYLQCQKLTWVVLLIDDLHISENFQTWMMLKEFCAKNLEFGGKSSLLGQQTTQPWDWKMWNTLTMQTGITKNKQINKQNLIKQLLLWTSNDLLLAFHRTASYSHLIFTDILYSCRGWELQ